MGSKVEAVSFRGTRSSLKKEERIRLVQCAMHSVDLRIPFSSAREAEIACGTLTVDKEPKQGVKKSISTDDKYLIVSFESDDVRILRVSVNSCFDYLKLIAETMQAFGPPR